MATSINYFSLPSYASACGYHWPSNLAADVKDRLKSIDPNGDGILTKAEIEKRLPLLNWNRMHAAFKQFERAFMKWKRSCAARRRPLVRCNCKAWTPNNYTRLAEKVVPPPKDLTSTADKRILKTLRKPGPSHFWAQMGYGGEIRIIGTNRRKRWRVTPTPRAWPSFVITTASNLLTAFYWNNSNHPVQEYKVEMLAGKKVRITFFHYSGRKTVIEGHRSSPHSFKFTHNPAGTKVIYGRLPVIVR